MHLFFPEGFKHLLHFPHGSALQFTQLGLLHTLPFLNLKQKLTNVNNGEDAVSASPLAKS
jgi:hypothetical protein